MTRAIPALEDVQRLREAGDWLQRLQEVSIDETALEAWNEWCARDPRNVDAFVHVEEVWRGFEPLAAGAAAPCKAGSPAPRAGGVRRRYYWMSAAAAAILISVAALRIALHVAGAEVFDTTIGEQRREVLADGSRLDLGADSRVSVRFDSGHRQIRLDKGEAFFTVTHDSSRPFIVFVDGIQVKAVGTEFDVRSGSDHTVVTVSEGRVKVSGEDGAGRARGEPGDVSVSAGQRLTYSRSSRHSALMNVSPGLAYSWRDGVLRFVAEPLQDVVDQVNRYSHRKVRVSDPELQCSLFTGTLSQTGVDDWLNALENVLPARVIDTGSGDIVIAHRSETAVDR
jgi:transmembrane sensor